MFSIITVFIISTYFTKAWPNQMKNTRWTLKFKYWLFIWSDQKYHHNCYRIGAKVRRGKLLGTDCRWCPSRMHNVISILAHFRCWWKGNMYSVVLTTPQRFNPWLWVGSSFFLFFVKYNSPVPTAIIEKFFSPLETFFLFILQRIQHERDKITRHRVKAREFHGAAAPYSTMEMTRDKGCFFRRGLLRRSLMLN